MADLERGVAIGPSTKFFLASASKPFTAMAVVLLVLDKKISLDDDVRKYVPELPNFGQPITVRHLLSHTSGLREESNLLLMAGWRSSDLQTENDVLGLLKRQTRPNFAPGSEFLYNNTGYTLLSIIVSRVAGTPFPEFIAKRIFRPLGMLDSRVTDDPGLIIPNRAVGYWTGEKGAFRLARIPYAFAGPTGVVTTLDDFRRWDANSYTMVVGGKAAQNLINEPGVLNDGTRTGYGLGVFLGSYKGRATIGHAGSDPGFKAEYIRFPREHFSVAVFCNAFDHPATPIARGIADTLLPTIGADATRSPTQVADQAVPMPVDAASFVGRYWNSDLAQVTHIFHENGKLFINGGNEGNFELRHIGRNRFLLPVAPRRYVLVFSVGPDGTRTLRKQIAGETERTFAEVKSGTPTTSLEQYAGTFHSDELDVDWTVRVEDGSLRISFPRFDEEPLSPVLPGVFQFAGGFFTVAFAPGVRGSSPNFEVTTERARRMLFNRAPTPNETR